MILIYLIVVVTLVARGLGAWKFAALNSWPASVRVALAVMFVLTGVFHFNSLRPDLVRMVPPWISSPEAVVTVSGIVEILGGIGLLIPFTRKLAAGGLLLLLVAVFPANVHAAAEGMQLGGTFAMPIFPRFLMQLLFIFLTWWSGFHNAKI